MSSIDIAKKVVPFVAGFGASSIAANIIRNNMTYTGKLAKLDKVAVPVASFFIGSMFSDVVEKHTTEQIDKSVAKFRKAFDKAVDAAESSDKSE